MFGLHSNAEIGYFVDNARNIWHGLLKINLSSSSGSKSEQTAGAVRENAVIGMVTDILAKLPEKGLYFSVETDAPSPTQVVLAQVCYLVGEYGLTALANSNSSLSSGCECEDCLVLRDRLRSGA